MLSTGFAFSLVWNVLENGYLEPHANTRIDFNKERGKVSECTQASAHAQITQQTEGGTCSGWASTDWGIVI